MTSLLESPRGGDLSADGCGQHVLWVRSPQAYDGPTLGVKTRKVQFTRRLDFLRSHYFLLKVKAFYYRTLQS